MPSWSHTDCLPPNLYSRTKYALQEPPRRLRTSSSSYRASDIELIRLKGPHSDLSSPVPTTCFVDVVIIPIPVWIALLLIPVMFVLSMRHHRVKDSFSTARPRSCLYKTTLTIYYLLIVCNILMETLEIVRLSLIHFGIGLLPFTYVGLIAGAALHWSKGISGRVSAWKAVNGVHGRD